MNLSTKLPELLADTGRFLPRHGQNIDNTGPSFELRSSYGFSVIDDSLPI